MQVQHKNYGMRKKKYSPEEGNKDGGRGMEKVQ